jgi:3-deoxy-D-manno-octulosonic-acid transferase
LDVAHLQAKTTGFLFQLMTRLYNLGIGLYHLSARVAAMGSKKAHLWVEGRKNLLPQIEESCKGITPSIWMHCPSLGEFEQGRPVLEELRKLHPNVPVVLTFFSPSGYEVRKNYAGANFVFYLPEDTPLNASHFVNAIQPKLAVFVKYDFWLHYLSELKKMNCTTLLVSGIFRPGQHFFKPWGGIGKQMLQTFTHLFVQDEESLQLLQSIGFTNASISGDTRFDRVAALKQAAFEIEVAQTFSAGHFTLVAGSTWSTDEIGLASWINQSLNSKLIIAQHEISKEGIERLEKMFTCTTVRYSNAEIADLSAARVLIIDSIGLLSGLYRYGQVAFVGGGFGKGVHNTLEPAVWGIPVIFGPKYQKFKEARDLVKLNAATVVSEAENINTAISVFQIDDKKRISAGTIAAKYVTDQTGATTQIIRWIQNHEILK